MRRGTLQFNKGPVSVCSPLPRIRIRIRGRPAVSNIHSSRHDGHDHQNVFDSLSSSVSVYRRAANDYCRSYSRAMPYSGPPARSRRCEWRNSRPSQVADMKLDIRVNLSRLLGDPTNRIASTCIYLSYPSTPRADRSKRERNKGTKDI